MRPRRAMPPRPDGAPDSAADDHRYGAEIEGQAATAARLVRPEHHADAQRDGERETRVHAERARRPRTGWRGRRRRPGAAARRWRRRAGGDRRNLLVDLRELLL